MLKLYIPKLKEIYLLHKIVNHRDDAIPPSKRSIRNNFILLLNKSLNL